ncbi:hypothetical protein [Flaviaesturariibacter amylovorans]|uniref:Uncharacterized protein n=1 Tax=Flaviaesturariibacter amylovorans TaxID=1084520 RepID=A0ABP8H4X5_9BACT
MKLMPEWIEMNAELADLSRQFADGVRSKRSLSQLKELNSRIVALLQKMKKYREQFGEILGTQDPGSKL